MTPYMAVIWLSSYSKAQLLSTEYSVNIPLAVLDQLHQVDYNHRFAILVLQELKGKGGYRTTVYRVSKQGNQVTVWARESFSTAAGTRVTGPFTSPHDFVAVSKQGMWGKPVRFVLMKDDKLVAEATHFIP
jgi:hypothetical protein